MYRTGDLGRIRTDGSVECTGRIDSQEKFRGFRIELNEVDASLSQHQFVRENVTLVRRDKNEEPTLVTYYVPETKRWLQHLELQEDGIANDQEIFEETMAGMLRRFKSLSEDCKKFLATKVPKYAIPTMFIPLARMPLSMVPMIAHIFVTCRLTRPPDPDGKIDKPSLPFPDSADLLQLGKRRASSLKVSMTDTQTRLAVIWASILPNRSSCMFLPESNFSDEGGHSILVQQMFFRVKKEWRDIDLPLGIIFQSQTLEALAAEIDRAQDPIGLRLDTMHFSGDQSVEDEAYAADARGLVQQLPDSIRGAAADYTDIRPTVFLTGATGFLGCHILRELLEGPIEASVIAHVRAEDSSIGLARVESTAKAYGLWSPTWISASRMQIVVGDIAKPHLGLSQNTWDQLVDTIDIIIHNGAVVNWMLPYSRLQAANVLSTLACVELCTTGKPKRLAFVSSTSTLDSAYYVRLSQETGTAVLETDTLEGSRKGLQTGYGQSKWASEYIVREAGRRGLVGAVIRPGYITGDPGSGIMVTDDFLVRLWKGSLQVKVRPDIANTLNAVPVTQVSRIVVAGAFHSLAAGGQFVCVMQVTSHRCLTLNDWMAALEVYGYPVPIVSYQEWCEKIQEYVGDNTKEEEHALLPLFHSVTGDLPANTFTPALDDTHAVAALRLYEERRPTQEGSLSASTVSKEALGMYLAYLVAVGFLPAPAKMGECELPTLEGVRIEAFATRHLSSRSTRPSFLEIKSRRK